MTTTRREIENLLVNIQSEFLTHPSLTLTVAQARTRCGGTLPLCRAVLEVLAETGVLQRLDDRGYRRRLPMSEEHVDPLVAIRADPAASLTRDDSGLMIRC